MADPISILGAVSASLSILDFACQGVKAIVDDVHEFKSYGHIISRLYHEVDTIHLFLEQWESEWNLEASEGKGLECFGPDGFKRIQEQLGMITETSYILVGLLAPFYEVLKAPDILLPPAPIPPSNPVPKPKRLQKPMPVAVKKGHEFLEKLPAQSFIALKNQKQRAKNLDEKVSLAKKLKDVLGSKQKEISENVKELRAGYFTLEKLSEKSFRVTHPTIRSDASHQERNQALQSERDLKFVSCFRKNAIEMIQSFTLPASAGSPTKPLEEIGLELNALKNSFSIPESVSYTLFIKPSQVNGSYSLSVLAVGPCLPDRANPVNIFVDAYAQAQRGEPAWLRVAGATVSDLYYSMTATPLEAAAQVARLAETLRNNSTSNRIISFRESLDLAFRLAYSCLLLLNTSCMSAFSSENLIMRIDQPKPSRYSLGFGANVARCQLLSQLQASPKSQAYSIGIILIELALRTKVITFIESTQTLRTSDARSFTLDAAIKKTRCLGTEFEKVVSCCFEMQLPEKCLDEDQNVYLDKFMLEDFYEDIYLPLKKLYTLSR